MTHYPAPRIAPLVIWLIVATLILLLITVAAMAAALAFGAEPSETCALALHSDWMSAAADVDQAGP